MKKIPAARQFPPDTKFCIIHKHVSYDIQILENGILTWVQAHGPHVGKSDREQYTISNICSKRVMISWVETGGLGVSHLINLNTHTVTTHAHQGRDVCEHIGRFEWNTGDTA